MIALAAADLGFSTACFAPPGDNPAFEVAGSVFEADYSDENALAAFGKACDSITFEFENVPGASLSFLESRVRLCPSPELLRISQDRLEEKKLFASLGLPHVPFEAVSSLEELGAAVEKLGFPAVLKTRRLGYDGKGQAGIARPEELETSFRELKSPSGLILEAFEPFDQELSLIVARDHRRQEKFFPLTRNEHKDHILHRSHVPHGLAPELEKQAKKYARVLAQRLDLEGLLAVEFFSTGNQIKINEIAPRPHNSGHWTMDACATSQFEQLVRIAVGWPLGDTRLLCPVIMENLLGQPGLDWKGALKVSHSKIYLYNKQGQPKGRKLGHINRLFWSNQPKRVD